MALSRIHKAGLVAVTAIVVVAAAGMSLRARARHGHGHGHDESWPEDWAAISPYFVDDALASLDRDGTEGRRRYAPASFCHSFGSPGREIVPSAACAPLLARIKRFPVCAVQNLGESGRSWQASVLDLDPVRVGDALAGLMGSLGCGSVIIDVESLAASQRDRYTAWVRDVARRLRQRREGARVSVAVHGKTDDRGSWDGAAAQDWRGLCDAADELVLMAYDFRIPGFTEPGELAPEPWVERVLRYGASVCPPARLRLGLAAYGYRWRTPGAGVITERDARRGGGLGAWPYVETRERRDRKRALARDLGVRRYFLWALGMEADQR